MRSIGFIISRKKDERRRLLLPEHIKMIKHPESLYFERGYGDSLSILDAEYEEAGCHVVDREAILRCDVIADRKLGDADYLHEIPDGRILFGAAHAIQGIEFTSAVLEHAHTVIATEEIFEHNRYVFYKNNELAGAAAVMHAFRYCGKMPYETKVAIIGNGNVAKGALRVLNGLGASTDVFGRKYEELFRLEMLKYDVIINCIKWDTNREDHLITIEDIHKMKKGTLIIDISCDPHLGIESSRATTISDPVYSINGIIHYAVDNTPSMFPYSATKIMSEKIWEYINIILETDFCSYPEELRKAIVIERGNILDKRIAEFRKKRGMQ